MSLSEHIKNEILNYHITGFDLWMAMFERGASHYFFPLSEDKTDQFTIQCGEKGVQLPFPQLAVKLLLMVIDKLAKGEAPALLPRYYELTFDDAVQIFNLSQKDQQELPRKFGSEYKILVQDIVDFKVNKIKVSIVENGGIVYFNPRDIISTYSRYPVLHHFIHEGDDGENLYFLKRKIHEIGSLKVTRNALMIVHNIMSRMTIAHTIMSFPICMDVTEEEAAEILGYSRDFVIKMLQNHEMPYRKEGEFYFISLSDLMKYKKTRDKDRLEAMQEMTDLWIDEIEIENGD
ncbi:MAG: helix-turn-helix domain-containing protein [Parachlamydia sp.]|nr:helix-turn-helix domain-containing protein [Parachlamydia sp.]